MPHITPDHYSKMRSAFRSDVTLFLASLAASRQTITYGDLTSRFGRNPRMWGDPLGGIAIRCHEAGLPLLAVLVVNAASGMPSVDAVLYKDLGLDTPAAVAREIERCFDFDWAQHLLRP